MRIAKTPIPGALHPLLSMCTPMYTHTFMYRIDVHPCMHICTPNDTSIHPSTPIYTHAHPYTLLYTHIATHV